MDAIENHAEALASAWKGSGSGSPPPGRLFVRELNSATAPRSPAALDHPARRRAGERETAEASEKAVGRGSVSDLVEKALRFEFGMGGDRG